MDISHNQTSLTILRSICQNSIDNEPKDATEKEQGYTIAMQHIIRLIDDTYLNLEKKQIITALEEGIKYGNDILPQSFDHPAQRYYHYTYTDK
jgi:hypothetical protein